jgi:hydrogenase maturation protease
LSDPATRSDTPGDPAGGVLVIGYGNTLRTDDGVGPRVAELLAGHPRLAGATVRACHQLSPELADDMRWATLVVLVDATTGAPPGAIVVRRVDLAGESRVDGGATSHHVDPDVLLALTRDLYGVTPETYLVSVGVADMGLGEALSPGVAAALPAAVEAVIRVMAQANAPSL